MVQSYDWIDIEEKSNINIDDIIYVSKEYDLIMDTELYEDVNETRLLLIKARSLTERLKTLVFSLFFPEENEYIKKYPREYAWLVDNIGRVNKQLDEFERDNIFGLDTIKKLGEDISKSSIFLAYAEKLRENIDMLVYDPLKRAAKRYFNEQKVIKDGEEKEVIKDKDLFAYFVFLEMTHNASLLGGLARQKNAYGKAGLSLQKNPTTFFPPDFPENVKTKEVEEETEEEFKFEDDEDEYI